MIQDGNININVDTNDILYLLADWEEKKLNGCAINVSYERILCPQVSKQQSWCSNIYLGLIRWKRGRIIQGDGWWNAKSYEKVHMEDCLEEFSCWSQCASRNMVFQVHEETWFVNQEIKDTILCDMGFPEDIVSWIPKLVFYSDPMGHSEVNVDFAVYCRFADSK